MSSSRKVSPSPVFWQGNMVRSESRNSKLRTGGEDASGGGTGGLHRRGLQEVLDHARPLHSSRCRSHKDPPQCCGDTCTSFSENPFFKERTYKDLLPARDKLLKEVGKYLEVSAFRGVLSVVDQRLPSVLRCHLGRLRYHRKPGDGIDLQARLPARPREGRCVGAAREVLATDQALARDPS